MRIMAGRSELTREDLDRWVADIERGPRLPASTTSSIDLRTIGAEILDKVQADERARQANYREGLDRALRLLSELDPQQSATLFKLLDSLNGEGESKRLTDLLTAIESPKQFAKLVKFLESN